MENGMQYKTFDLDTTRGNDSGVDLHVACKDMPLPIFWEDKNVLFQCLSKLFLHYLRSEILLHYSSLPCPQGYIYKIISFGMLAFYWLKGSHYMQILYLL